MIKKITLVTKSFFKFIAAFVALFTMTISPLAQAAQAESLKKDALERMLSDIGLNRQITVGDFYQKNKQLFPEGIRLQIEPMIEQFKDQMMPVFELTMLQNSNGEQTPVIRVTQQGQLHTIQIYDDENKTVRFNNTDLSLQDVENFNLMIDKLYYREPRLRKQVGGPDKMSSARNFAKDKPFIGLPQINPKVWNNYTVKEKSQYIYNLRKLWTQANDVLEKNDRAIKEKNKTSFFNLFVNEIYATPRKDKPVAGSLKKGEAGRTKISFKDNTDNIELSDENTCVIAGYISMYVRGKCSADMNVIRKKYGINEGQNPKMDAAIKFCESKGQMACNSYIYGLDNSGNGICVAKTGDDFQKATHANGPCEKASPLGPEVAFLKDDKIKSADRYSDENMKIKDLESYYREQFEKDANYQSNVERFLMSMTVSDGKNVNFNEALSLDVVKQLQQVQDEFNKNIVNAREACKAAAKNKQYDKNFWGACDQLQRRFLFVREFLKNKPGCPDKQAPNENFMCTCPNGADDVTPGSKCSDKPAGTPVSSTTVVDQGASETAPVQSGQCSEKCKDNEICKNLNTANYGGRDRWVCIPDGKSSSGVWDKIWKYGKWALIGVGIYAGVKYLLPVFFPKKPKLNAAGDACANGISSACVTTCPNRYQSRVNGVCQCAVCPPGTSLVDGTTCTCSTAATASVLFTCADKVTQVTDQSLCPPTANIRCPDGVTYVTNINACPNTPSVKPSSSGTGQ